jgi:PAS domain S-box-containing protein
MSEIYDTALNPESLLATLNDGVYAVDTERKIFYWSPAAERITGWRAEDILGKTCFDDVLCHVDKDGHQLCGHEHCPLHRAMVTNHGSDVPIIVFAQNNKGGRVPMRVSVAPIRNASGEVVGGVETFHDASEEHQDVELARRIQSAMLRKQILQDQRLTFTTYYLPWGMIGGDYYAIERVDEDRFAFILADVSGHGYAAAMYTVYLNALWHSHLDLLVQPAELAKVMHGKLSTLIGDDARFATAVFGLLDLKQMRATLTYAGGPTPLLFGGNGKLEVLEGAGIPLGMPIDVEYSEQVVPIHPGDCLLAFTDGVSEITDVNGKLLDVEGLVRILKEIGYPESRDFKAVEEKLLVFSDRIRFNDDLTFLEARVINETKGS